MSARPQHAIDVLAAVARCPGLTARGIAEETGISVATVYRVAHWLEAHGDIERSDEWPAGFSPRIDAEYEIELFADAVDRFGDVKDLLAEAMQSPGWEATPGDVKHKIEHAWVELTRDD